MAYATQTDMIDRYGERLLINLTDREDAPTGAIDSVALCKALDDATAEIDSYIGRRYVVPLTEVPSTVVTITCILAIWALHTYDPDPKIEKDWKAALARLRDIAEGRMAIPGAAGVEPATTGGGGARTTDRERPFTEQSLKSFI